MWCVAELNAEYIHQMEDVLALYERPYNRKAPVVCLDEKPVSLHAEVRPPRPARPGHLAKRDNEYRRFGTGNIFAIVEPKAGRHFTHATPNRSGAHFARAIQQVVAGYPDARRIHLVVDDSEYPLPEVADGPLRPAPGPTTLAAPQGAHYAQAWGWLNQADIELSLISRGCLGRRRLGNLAQLTGETRAWIPERTGPRPAFAGSSPGRTRDSSSVIKRISLTGQRPSQERPRCSRPGHPPAARPPPWPSTP